MGRSHQKGDVERAETGVAVSRQRVGDRVSNARTRLALRVAPWLSSEEEF